MFFKLIVPSVLFSIIEFFPSYYLRGREFGIGEFLYKTIGGGTYWFISALVICEVLFLIMLLFRRRKIVLYLSASIVLFAVGKLICNLESVEIRNYWAFRQALFSAIFFAIGGVYWKLEKYLKKFSKVFSGMFLFVFYLFLVTMLDSKSKVLISTLDINWLGVVVSLIGIVALIEICQLFGKIQALDYIGRNTITFYFTSGAFPIILSTIVKKISPQLNYMGLLAVFVFSTGFAFIATMFINKFVPFLLDLRVLKKPKEQKTH